MGAFHSGALTVFVTLNHLYPMKVANTRNIALLPVRGISFTAVVGHLDALVLLRNRILILTHSEYLFEADPMPNGYNERATV